MHFSAALTAPLALALLLGGCATPRTDRSAPTLENTLGMRLVRIPAGSFQMGSGALPDTLAQDYPQYERGRLEALFDEAPVHPVHITRAFFMGQSEVTVGQFRKFLEASGYVPESVADGTGGYGYNAAYNPDTTERGDTFEGRNPRYSWQNPGFPQSDDHPVLNVTWNDAVAMAQWLSRQEGAVYRLPTEAEWEYACRAGSHRRYADSDAPDSLPTVANTFDADAARIWPRWQAQALAGHDGYAFTAPVGSFSANGFGLYDMLGNAWEWTSDWYSATYYAASPVEDPQGPAQGEVRVRRGGSWHSWALYARCAYRNWNTPQTRYTLVGFRLVRDIADATR